MVDRREWNYWLGGKDNDTSEAGVEAQRRYSESGAVPYRLRSALQVAESFEGLEVVEPGVGRKP